jgi:hypothetical protein
MAFKSSQYGPLNITDSALIKPAGKKKSTSSGGSMSSKRRKHKTSRYRQWQNALKNKRASHQTSSSDDSDANYHCNDTLKFKVNTSTKNTNKKRISPSCSHRSTPFSNSPSGKSDIGGSDTKGLNGNAVSREGPKEDKWNNLDEMIRRINSNLSNGSNMAHNSLSHNITPCDTPKNTEEQERVSCNKALDNVNGYSSRKNKDGKKSGKNSSNNPNETKQQLSYSTKHSSLNVSDTSERELNLRMSEDDDEEGHDYMVQQKEQTPHGIQSIVSGNFSVNSHIKNSVLIVYVSRSFCFLMKG